nr:V-type ATPase c subunit [Capsicum annuum]
MVQRRVG